MSWSFLFMISYMWKTSQPAGELVFVKVSVFWDMSEGTILPRAAYCPPEKAFLLVAAVVTRTTILFTVNKKPGFNSHLEDPSYPGFGLGLVAPEPDPLSPIWNLYGYRTVSGAPSMTIPWRRNILLRTADPGTGPSSIPWPYHLFHNMIWIFIHQCTGWLSHSLPFGCSSQTHTPAQATS